MDKQEKEQLKHDVFVDEVTHGIEYAATHKKQLGMYGVILGVVVAAGVGWYWWSNQQAEQRAVELGEALTVQQAAVGPGSNPYLRSFTTQAEKDAELRKVMGALAAKYPGKDEGSIAQYYIGISYADSGNFAEAEKYWKQVIDSGNKEYGSLCRFSLAQMYARQGKKDLAEKEFRYLIDNPTTMLSSENAKIELAKLLASSKPEEAQKLLEPLRQMSTRNAVSRWAITAYGETRAGQGK